MYLIDSHTHIFTEEFDSDRADVIRRSLEAGVQKLCLPNIDPETVSPLHSVCEDYPSLCYPMMGLHPTSVKHDYPELLAKIKSFFSTRKYIAVGEIGIDLYWDKTFLKEQTDAFEEQLRWSVEWQLPVAIHSRNAFPQVFESLDKVGANRLRGVFHSFEGSYEELEKALSYRNFFLGINGIVTYKKADFRNYITLAPVERLLLETDAPYLTPVPHRGKRNEPAYLLYVVGKLAEIYGLSVETMANKTTENAQRLFGL
ncbi:MAG: TatD family hydrolase [Dysgonamonadaceae bacterium]|jgi:TatD DNase family protein|nr:TatD family hydrolase [Dysgonamonadaceae bacterium]